MLDRTRKLWEKQTELVGDRRALFAATADAISGERVLYPGSYVDITPSFVWPSVTYLDVDRRANQLFNDAEGVQELLVEHGVQAGRHQVSFVHSDYTDDLALGDEAFDLLISLYAGFISEHCTKHLRVGGFLLVNPSHGDAAMASIDARYVLRGVVMSEDGDYRIETDALDSHLIPKRDVDVTVEYLHEWGRAVAYTRSAFAYLFERVR